jgi:hypothetical protein
MLRSVSEEKWVVRCVHVIKIAEHLKLGPATDKMSELFIDNLKIYCCNSSNDESSSNGPLN